MRILWNVLFLLVFLAPRIGKSQNSDTVRVSDGVHIYYYDLFNDRRVFDWGTVPKNFNFNNYRIYFKNNSNDTLIRGRVTTGDGKVRYVYAGTRDLILPGAYFVIKPLINTSLRYRMGRFSKLVSMTAIGADSTYRFSHRFLGFFSSDTVLPPPVPTIKIKEPLNPPLTDEEIENYADQKKEIQRILAYRKYKPVRAFVKGNPEDVRFNIKIYLSKKGDHLDDNAVIIYKRYAEEIALEKIHVKGERSYFIFPNRDSVANAPIEIRLNGRKYGYHKNMSATGRQEVYLDIQNGPLYVVDQQLDSIQKKVDEHEVVSEPRTQAPVRQNFPESTIQIFMLDGKSRITENCKAEIFIENPMSGQSEGWNVLKLKTDDRGLYLLEQTIYIDKQVKKIRWRYLDNDWQYDQYFTGRQPVQSFIRHNDSVSYAFGFYGKVALNYDPTYFHYSITDPWIQNNISTSVDSVRRVLKWYGIPYKSVRTDDIHLINSNDMWRTQRALKKHFNHAILLPYYSKSRWLCGSGHIYFSEKYSPAEIKQLINHPCVKSFSVNHLTKSKSYEVSIHFNDMIGEGYHAFMEELYQNPNVLKLKTDFCQITRLD